MRGDCGELRLGLPRDRRIAKALLAKCLALLAACALLFSCSYRKPNIILIVADDLGFETIGAYGGASYATPNIDALAASGVRFTHAYSTPLCSPSRVQLMTGRYTHRSYTQWGVLPPAEISFAQLLRNAGYATFAAGKWQLWGHQLLWDPDGDCCLHQGQTPDDAGFDDYLLWYVGGKGNRYADPLLWTAPDRSAEHAGQYGPAVVADFLIDRIERHVRTNPRQPFLAYYPMILPHAPFTPTPDDAGWSTDRHADDPAHFPAMVEYADKLVGRLMAKLDELGIRDDTLVLFTADNGTPAGIESRMRDGTTLTGAKGRTTDGGTRVPLIASWPRVVRRGSVSDALVDFTDVLPSLAEAASLFSVPDDRIIDGVSFTPLLWRSVLRNGVLRSIAPKTRDWVFTDYRPKFPGVAETAYVRDRRFKLYDDGRFYDVANDALEERPLAADALTGKARRARGKLQTALDRLLTDTANVAVRGKPR